MRAASLLRIVLLTAFIFVWHSAAQAQANPSPSQIQALIANGQSGTAVTDLQAILQARPDSGIAWYLMAEAQDATGNPAAARTALANAQQYAPGLPFARPASVAALQARLAAGTSVPTMRHGFGLSPTTLVIGGLILLFIVMRFFRTRRVMPQAGFGPPGFPGQPPGYPPRPPVGPFGYGQGQGGMPYQQPQGGFGGSGIGGSIVSGLAAGAGIAAGERLIGGLMGGGAGGGTPFDPAQNIDPTPMANPDDGLLGSPGWDNSSGWDNNSGQDDDLNSGGIDPNSNW